MDSNDSMFYFYDKSKYARHVININSEDRVDYLNTKPNDFTVYLKNPILNIVGIKLIGSVVPNTQYVINATNNRMDFVDTGYPIVTPIATIVNHSCLGLPAINQLDLALVDIQLAGYYVGYIIKITSGLASGDIRYVTAYAPNTVTVSVAFTAGIVAGDTYTINPPPLIANHVAVGGSLTTAILAAGDVKPANYYNGYVLEVMSGGAAGNIRTISGYNNATNTVTVDVAFNGIIAPGDTYNVYTQFNLFSGGNQALAGSTSSVTLASADLRTEDYYIGYKIEMTGGAAAGDIRVIRDYNSTINTVYVSSPFSAAVVDTDTYNIYNQNHWTSILTPGTYSAMELANQINAKMNATLGVPFGAEFVPTYVTYLQKFQIDCVAPGHSFSLLFGSGSNKTISPAYVMGFEPVDTSLSSSASSINPVRLMGEDYVYLCIRDMGTIRMETIKDVFARMVLDSPPRTIIYNSFISNAKIFRSPLTKLEKIDIRFVMKNNILYDFNTFENSITLEVYTLGTGGM